MKSLDPVSLAVTSDLTISKAGFLAESGSNYPFFVEDDIWHGLYLVFARLTRAKAQSAGYGLLRRSLLRLVAVGRDSSTLGNCSRH